MSISIKPSGAQGDMKEGEGEETDLDRTRRDELVATRHRTDFVFSREVFDDDRVRVRVRADHPVFGKGKNERIERQSLDN